LKPLLDRGAGYQKTKKQIYYNEQSILDEHIVFEERNDDENIFIDTAIKKDGCLTEDE
jgi:hypothetical protein